MVVDSCNIAGTPTEDQHIEARRTADEIPSVSVVRKVDMLSDEIVFQVQAREEIDQRLNRKLAGRDVHHLEDEVIQGDPTRDRISHLDHPIKNPS